MAVSDHAVTVRQLHYSTVSLSTTTTHMTTALSPEAAKQYVAGLSNQELANLQKCIEHLLGGHEAPR